MLVRRRPRGGARFRLAHAMEDAAASHARTPTHTPVPPTNPAVEPLRLRPASLDSGYQFLSSVMILVKVRYFFALYYIPRLQLVSPVQRASPGACCLGAGASGAQGQAQRPRRAAPPPPWVTAPLLRAHPGTP